MFKRILFFLLFGVLLFSFVGCGTVEDALENNGESFNSEATENTTSTQEDRRKAFFYQLQETDLFEFSYNEEQTVWKRGEKAEISYKMEYVGKEPLPYGGPSGGTEIPEIIVYQNTDESIVLSEESFEIYPSRDFVSVTTDVLPEFYAGFVANNSSSMAVPKDAPLGKYHLILRFQYYCKIFENAIEIVE